MNLRTKRQDTMYLIRRLKSKIFQKKKMEIAAKLRTFRAMKSKKMSQDMKKRLGHL